MSAIFQTLHSIHVEIIVNNGGNGFKAPRKAARSSGASGDASAAEGDEEEADDDEEEVLERPTKRPRKI